MSAGETLLQRAEKFMASADYGTDHWSELPDALVRDLATEIERLSAGTGGEVDARDAARYRWLRDEPTSHLYVRLKEKITTSGMSVCSGPTLDHEIDKRIARTQEPR
jgi:hypothetical protein